MTKMKTHKKKYFTIPEKLLKDNNLCFFSLGVLVFCINEFSEDGFSIPQMRKIRSFNYSDETIQLYMSNLIRCGYIVVTNVSDISFTFYRINYDEVYNPPDITPPKPKTRFTGIFIPVEILEIKGLSNNEKILLSYIDALYCKDAGGCFASNQYLSEKLDVTADCISKCITLLKRMGLIEQVSFDGRRRIIRAKIGEFVSESQKNPRGLHGEVGTEKLKTKPKSATPQKKPTQTQVIDNQGPPNQTRPIPLEPIGHLAHSPQANWPSPSIYSKEEIKEETTTTTTWKESEKKEAIPKDDIGVVVVVSQNNEDFISYEMPSGQIRKIAESEIKREFSNSSIPIEILQSAISDAKLSVTPKTDIIEWIRGVCKNKMLKKQKAEEIKLPDIKPKNPKSEDNKKWLTDIYNELYVKNLEVNRCINLSEKCAILTSRGKIRSGMPLSYDDKNFRHYVRTFLDQEKLF